METKATPISAVGAKKKKKHQLCSSLLIEAATIACYISKYYR